MTIQDDISAKDIVIRLRERFGMDIVNAQIVGDGAVEFALYQALAFSAAFDDYGRGNWGFSLMLGGRIEVTTLLGEDLLILGTWQRIDHALDVIDRYCRLRLGTEYLAAFDAARPD